MAFTSFCGVCYEDLKEQFETIYCHPNCVDMTRLNIEKRIDVLKKKLKYSDDFVDDFVDDFCTYEIGETTLSEEHKRLIKEAYELRNHSYIIDYIFDAVHSNVQKSKDIFDFMMKEDMIEEINYEKSVDGPSFAKVFDRCKGHYGENKSKRCGRYMCFDCKEESLGKCMVGFEHCCCFKLRS